MTFNVRYDNPDDGPSAWPFRKERVARVMEQADIIGVQEALKHQVADLEALLPDYAWVGVGRDDGIDQGEFAPIFYRADRFQVDSSGTFWLSETPGVPGSKSWDAAITRIVTWALLRSSISGDTLWLFNTHFDHRGEEARKHSAQLLMSRVSQMVGESAVVVTGDFNATPDSDVYDTMMAGSLVDPCALGTASRSGPEGTFSGFEVRDRAPDRRIDYVFVGHRTNVRTCAAIVDVVYDRYVSDHLPVMATIRYL